MNEYLVLSVEAATGQPFSGRSAVNAEERQVLAGVPFVMVKGTPLSLALDAAKELVGKPVAQGREGFRLNFSEWIHYCKAGTFGGRTR